MTDWGSERKGGNKTQTTSTEQTAKAREARSPRASEAAPGRGIRCAPIR